MVNPRDNDLTTRLLWEDYEIVCRQGVAVNANMKSRLRAVATLVLPSLIHGVWPIALFDRDTILHHMLAE